MMKFSNPRNNNKNRPFKRNNNHHRRQGDSNSGPKVSGNLTTVLEKYKNLAKDATSAGDYIAAENYLQHAEHFVRVLNERNSKNNGETKPPVSIDNGTSENNVVSDVFQTDYGYHFLEVLGTRNFDQTSELIEDRAYSALYSRKFDEELENTLRSMRAEAFVEIKTLD